LKPSELTGIERTLLVPLACRAMESVRPDAIIHDPRAVEVYNALEGGLQFLMGMRGHDLFAAVMRVRQFDAFAREFLASHPDGLVVDIGCGLDTRFDRLDDGSMLWLGIDLPEVIELRRQLLPDTERCLSFSASMLDLEWLRQVEAYKRPVIFLAEGVFPYFSLQEVEPMLKAIVGLFHSGELVFDAPSPLMARFHNLTSSVLRESGANIKWKMKDPHDLEAWGLTLLNRWGFFEKKEQRLGAANLIRFIPPIARATYILHYCFGQLRS
jgi:O-methyltransferase involved in polyketide biosynthesis